MVDAMTTVLPLDRKAVGPWARTLLAGPLAVIDVETTGLGQDAYLVEVALVDGTGRVLLDELVNPERPIPYAATLVHGLEWHHVQHAPTLPALWPRLAPLLAGRTLVAYNTPFDQAAVALHATAAGLALPASRWACAMRAYQAFAGRPRWCSLDVACYAEGIVRERRHRAVDDARATLALLRTMAD